MATNDNKAAILPTGAAASRDKWAKQLSIPPLGRDQSADYERLKRRLAIFTVSAQIAEVIALVGAPYRVIVGKLHTAVEWPRPARAELRLESLQHRAPGE